MATLAFLGLGQMGGPMAARLLEVGHQLTVWNRTPQRAEPLASKGARVASSPAEAVREAEAAITMVADPQALEEVVFGPGGLAEGLGPGQALVDMSTVGPRTVRELRRRLPEALAVVDAPVLGTIPQAEEGTLKVFVGGADADFARWREVLGALGTPLHVGPLGSGASMKLVTNSVLGALMSALGEALALADALGLDLGTTLDVLSDSPIGVTATRKRENIRAGTFPPNFKLSLAAKDLRLVNEAAGDAGAELRVAAAARAWLEAADAAGFGDLDYSAVVAHIRGRSPTGPASAP